MSEAVILQWRFNQRGKAVWSAPTNLDLLIDVPAEGEMTKENRGYIDSFVAVGPPQVLDHDQPALAQFVRVDNRSIKLKLDPPDIVYAYRRWQNGEATIIGDVGLWMDTFMMLGGEE